MFKVWDLLRTSLTVVYDKYQSRAVNISLFDMELNMDDLPKVDEQNKSCKNSFNFSSSSEVDFSSCGFKSSQHLDSEGCFAQRRYHESKKEYKNLGYHPVEVGDVYKNRYRVIRQLGYEDFSTVWVAMDRKTGDWVALKIKRSGETEEVDDNNNNTAEDKKDLTEIPDDDLSSIEEGEKQTVIILDEFVISGPNGIHMCIVTTMDSDTKYVFE